MNIFWISGRSGYGKTEFANSVIEPFKRKNKKVEESPEEEKQRLERELEEREENDPFN